MLDFKRIGLLSAMVLMLGMFLGAAPAYAAGLSVDPSYGHYDTTYDVQANGFSKNEPVSLWVTLADGKSVQLGTVKASGSGSVEFSFTPQSSWRAGDGVVVAHGQNSKHEASAKFTLATEGDGSSIASSTASNNGSALTVTGATVQFEGSGYIPGERVATWFQYPNEAGTNSAHALPDVIADASGNVSFPFTVQKGWIFGEYSIAAQGAQSKITTSNVFGYFGGDTITDIQRYQASVTGTVTNGDWFGQYYNNVDLSGDPVLTRTDPEINFNWGTGSPAPQVQADNFSVRWTSTRTVSTAGNYTITATADDGIRVWVDGALVIDGWYDHPATTFSATSFLNAGDHNVRVEYYERGGFASAVVQITAD